MLRSFNLVVPRWQAGGLGLNSEDGSVREQTLTDAVSTGKPASSAAMFWPSQIQFSLQFLSVWCLLDTDTVKCYSPKQCHPLEYLIISIGYLGDLGKRVWNTVMIYLAGLAWSWANKGSRCIHFLVTVGFFHLCFPNRAPVTSRNHREGMFERSNVCPWCAVFIHLSSSHWVIQSVRTWLSLRFSEYE